MSKAKTPHPTISDVAMQLASRSNPPQSKITLERLERYVKIGVEVADTDAQAAADKAAALFDILAAKYPRENGQ